jgi:hypothetical protein
MADGALSSFLSQPRQQKPQKLSEKVSFGWETLTRFFCRFKSKKPDQNLSNTFNKL